jgi:hypothetical protein
MRSCGKESFQKRKIVAIVMVYDIWSYFLNRSEEFFIFILSWFSKNKWSNQNFREMYIWLCTPRRQEFLPPWGTALGVAPTVGCTARWGQIPAAVGHDGRNPSVVAHGGRTPSAVPHDGSILAPWGTAAAPRLYKRPTPAAGPSPTPPNLRLSTLRSTSDWAMFLNLVQFS